MFGKLYECLLHEVLFSTITSMEEKIYLLVMAPLLICAVFTYQWEAAYQLATNHESNLLWHILYLKQPVHDWKNW